MLMVRADQHEGDVGHILAPFQSRDVLEDVVSVVRFAVVRFLEKLELDRAARHRAAGQGQLRPDVDPPALFATAPKRLFQFDREGLTLAHQIKVGDHGDDAAEMELERCLALAHDAPTPDLLEQPGDGDVDDLAEAGSGHPAS